ncbi:hypothetical protein MJ561_27560 [Klebsiella pneumoniae]|nr:hypothetical protein MJ561_27560 [Klebsiella pneumoniae]
MATTISEKIGKKGATYAQGMSARMTRSGFYRSGELHRDVVSHPYSPPR